MKSESDIALGTNIDEQRMKIKISSRHHNDDADVDGAHIGHCF